MRKHAAALLVGFGLPFLAACMTGKTDAGTDYSYRLTTLYSRLDHPIEKVYEEAAGAMKEDFRLEVTQSGLDGFEGRILATGATGKVHRIHLEKAGPKTTKIDIHIAPRGDDARSRQILARIEERLKG